MLSIALYSQQSQPTRVGMIIGIKPDKISAYEALHAASNQGVRDLLDKYHMHNFSIYIQKMDESHYYLFAYYEYTGNNYKQDMDTMARSLAISRGSARRRDADSLRGRKSGPRCRRYFTILDNAAHPFI